MIFHSGINSFAKRSPLEGFPSSFELGRIGSKSFQTGIGLSRSRFSARSIGVFRKSVIEALSGVREILQPKFVGHRHNVVLSESTTPAGCQRYNFRRYALGENEKGRPRRRPLDIPIRCVCSLSRCDLTESVQLAALRKESSAEYRTCIPMPVRAVGYICVA